MNISISQEDISRLSLLGVDSSRFCDILRTVTLGKNTEGEDVPSPFELCQLSTAWGLLIGSFKSPQGNVTRALNIELLELTKELVISSDGVPVDRYYSIAAEWIRGAKQMLEDSPSAVPLIRPKKDVLAYKIRDEKPRKTVGKTLH